jgi:hypothetical protein
MHEILSVEQPCILCAQPIEIVTLSKDSETGEERIERTRLDHSERSCAATLALYREAFPSCLDY